MKAVTCRIYGVLQLEEVDEPVLDQTFALGEVADAIRHVEGGHTRGKTIVTTTRS
jgi:hypothetical protein